MPKMDNADLLHQLGALEMELNRHTWFTPAPQVKKISVETAVGVDDFEWSLFEQLFAAARAHLSQQPQN